MEDILSQGISALFVREDSIYKKLGIDSWDINRDVRNFYSNNIVIAHPPCRTWGNLSHFSKGSKEEHNLSILAANIVRINGGILEHPRTSKLFNSILPYPGTTDVYGGFTINIDQFWFGHEAKKNTFLYICGIDKSELLPIPLRFACVTYAIGGSRKKNSNYFVKKDLSRKKREATPLTLAVWLIETAKIIRSKRFIRPPAPPMAVCP
jgi:hypothetical protein